MMFVSSSRRTRFKSWRQNYRKIPAGKRKRHKSAPAAAAGPGLPVPGKGKHAPAHAPPRAPKITRAGRAPTRPRGTHPEVTRRLPQGLGALSPETQGTPPPRGSERPSRGNPAPSSGPGCPPRAQGEGKRRTAAALWPRRGASRGSRGPRRAGGVAGSLRTPTPQGPSHAEPRHVPPQVALRPAAPRGSAQRAGAAGLRVAARPRAAPEGGSPEPPPPARDRLLRAPRCPL